MRKTKSNHSRARKRKYSQVDLKTEIEREFESSGYHRSHRETKFVSLDFINRLFTSAQPPKLKRSIEHDLARLKTKCCAEDLEGVEIDKLVGLVANKAAKLYALLLLIGESDRIVSLLNVDHPLTDKIFEKGENSNDVAYCTLEYLKEIPQLDDIADKIYNIQWWIPPIFKTEIDYSFPPRLFRHPFHTVPQTIGKGGFGKIYKVKFAEGHLKGDDYDGSSVVAVKVVDKGDLTTVEKMMREVKTIRARKHENIVTFLTSFIAGRDNPWDEHDEVECLHMIFEHTDRHNLQTWLYMDSPPEDRLSDRKTIRKEITKCVKELVSAVTFIHSEIKGHIAYHHDLKPENILLFKGAPGAVWKICDFGMANLKHHQDESGTSHRPDKGIGTYMYQPPEYFFVDQEPKHGRPFDVYSLGCILLELATVWKHGWSPAGIKTFNRRRGDSSEHACGKIGKPNVDHSFHNSPKVVQSWILELREGQDDGYFKILLDLITEMLLERSQRIFIWEVDMDLFAMEGSPVEAQLKEHLRKVVQPPDTFLNNLNDEHNPLKRAIDKGKHWKYQSIQDILKHNKWSVDKPRPIKRTATWNTTGPYYTTLGGKSCPRIDDFKKNILFGRHKMDKDITQGFRLSNCVGLYGMSGMGKSHLAYKYAVSFENTKDEQQRKHTFWVEASTKARLQETVRGLANAIGLDVSELEDPLIPVNEWLSDPENGPWIMVVDGLDDKAVAAKAKTLLCNQKESGQIIITTKNKAILNKLDYLIAPRYQGQTCIPVIGLETCDSRRFFQSCGGEGHELTDSDEMEDFLKRLSNPVLMRLVVKYACDNETPTSTIYRWIKEGEPFEPYDCFSKDQMIFGSFIASEFERPGSNGRCQIWPQNRLPDRLKLLGQLSCLNRDEIDIHLLQEDWENERALLEMMGLLVNFSYIGKSGDGEDRRYFVYAPVQDMVRQWLLKNLGPVSLLELHADALYMLVMLFNDNNKKEEENSNNVCRSSYLLKLPYMSHFDCFLNFVKVHKSKPEKFADFKCHDRFVQSVVEFSHVYMFEGRYDDAVCVLEFTRDLYKGVRYRPHLLRTLSKAYILPPLARTGTKKWIKAADLLEDAVNGCPESVDSEQKWLCVLALANLYSESLRPQKASKALRSLPKLGADIKLGSIHADRAGGIEEIKKDLAIKKKIAESNVHIAKASKDPRIETKELQNALAVLETAKSDLLLQFSAEDYRVLGVEQRIADVLCKMDDARSISQGIEIFRRLNNRSEVVFNQPTRKWSQKRIWDIKCHIACAQVRLRAGLEDVAITDLKYVLKLYEKHYGPTDEHTHACARHLQETYQKLDRFTEAKKITERYGLETIKYFEFDDETVSEGISDVWLSCIAVFAVLLLALFCI